MKLWVRIKLLEGRLGLARLSRIIFKILWENCKQTIRTRATPNTLVWSPKTLTKLRNCKLKPDKILLVIAKTWRNSSWRWLNKTRSKRWSKSKLEKSLRWPRDGIWSCKTSRWFSSRTSPSGRPSPSIQSAASPLLQLMTFRFFLIKRIEDCVYRIWNRSILRTSKKNSGILATLVLLAHFTQVSFGKPIFSSCNRISLPNPV